MNINQSPRKLPTNFIAIAASVLIAGSGYMLFSVRYGKPIREANQAASRMDSLERKLPSMVKESVDSAYEKTTAGVRGELGTRLAESEASRESLASRVVQLEQETARLRVSLQQLIASTPQPGSTHQATSHAATPSEAAPIVSDSVNQPAFSQSSRVSEYLGSAQEGDIRIDIVSAKVAGKQAMIEMLVTKATAGDGYFAITNSIHNNHRMVTADGLEFDNLSVGRSGGSASRSFKIDLISGTPMRVMLYFQGQLPTTPFLARRIEFTAYEDRARKIPLQFQLDNITVSK